MIQFKALNESFAVCKLVSAKQVDITKEYTFFARTADENSLLCLDADVPADALAVERDWRGFKIEGTLDFSLVGIIAKISGVLADKGIPVFVVSTFNTDYVFVKSAFFENALAALKTLWPVD